MPQVQIAQTTTAQLDWLMSQSFSVEKALIPFTTQGDLILQLIDAQSMHITNAISAKRKASISKGTHDCTGFGPTTAIAVCRALLIYIHGAEAHIPEEVCSPPSSVSI